ncbi:hypothetical protein LIER_40438 [Lithospermum erythrorhizon]|uniref:KIB1-4 beta-propeller domain-containing protein n=1 Tax=Lithospermum erythrorhizon TaxID=34254 RepID=A0AAV3QXJ4_LITER
MATKEANWATLPDLALCLILEKLVALSDFLRLAAVCLNGDDLASKQLLVSSEQLSVPHSLRYSGSSYGWLAFGTGEENDFEVTLYNPFTRDKINDLPHIEKELTMLYPHFFIIKVILSANPSVSRDDLYIVVIYDGMHELALLKYGQKSWTYIDFMGINLVSADVIFFRGLLYAVTFSARIASIDIIGSLNMKKQEAPQPIFILQNEAVEYAKAEYLVESSQGELLLVKKYYYLDEEDVQTNFRFKVYKVVISSDGNGAKLEEVKSLGNDALFVGDNHSMSVSILEFPECQPDSIYFTDDGYDPGFYRNHGPRNNGIYNLKDGTIQNHYQPHPGEEKHMLPPIWVIPSANF